MPFSRGHTAQCADTQLRATKSVTILVCTPDVNSRLARRCINSIKKHTPSVDYELLIFDNGGFGSFHHPLEINRALEIARGDALVTIDDDVEVTAGWLEAMLDLAHPDVGIVGCVNLNSRRRARNTVRHAGGWFELDGTAVNHQNSIEKPIAVPFVCSSCSLIADKSLRLSLDYKKYYQEADLCLRCWETGKRVLVSPHRVYHYGQGQMEALGCNRDEILAATAEDLRTFRKNWVQSERLLKLYDRIRTLVDIPLPSAPQGDVTTG